MRIERLGSATRKAVKQHDSLVDFLSRKNFPGEAPPVEEPKVIRKKYDGILPFRGLSKKELIKKKPSFGSLRGVLEDLKHLRERIRFVENFWLKKRRLVAAN